MKVIAQKSYGGLNTDLRGARLDVYVESDDSAEIDASEDASIYDLEPDKNDKAKYIAAFPQRIRFYLSCYHRQPQPEIGSVGLAGLYPLSGMNKSRKGGDFT